MDHYGPFFEFWFDGANGGDGWYGGACETRSIDAEQYYQYEKARDIIWKKSPNTMIFGGTVPTIRWIGNEKGVAETSQWCNYTYNYQDLNDTKRLATGIPDGNVWLPAEVDVSIRPGWFYHGNESPKSLEELLEIYYQSVGRNASLLLNFPVAPNGRISPADSTRAVEWYKTLQQTFANNLLKDLKPTSTEKELIYTFDKPTLVSHLVLEEDVLFGQHVERFSISYYSNGKWLPVKTDDGLTTIGFKRIIRFKPVNMEKLRIRILKTKAPVCFYRVSAY